MVAAKTLEHSEKQADPTTRNLGAKDVSDKDMAIIEMLEAKMRERGINVPESRSGSLSQS
jgi:hypothetical protein